MKYLSKYQERIRSLQGAIVALYVIVTIGLFYLSVGKNLFFTNQILGLVFLSLTTDTFLLFAHIFRRPTNFPNVSFDAKKLSIIITAYKSEDVIGETIKNALNHVPADRIFVVCDLTPDPRIQERVAEIARSMGTQVFKNSRNVNKALGISGVIKHVTTPYVLTIDDDTYIGNVFIPTNLLDEGYSAVAFNVMPKDSSNVVTKFQTFEYRKSMFLGKHLRSGVGAIGNVSGAIGLFHTADLLNQAKLHSGQFGGEDQQRTLLIHLEGKGKGVVFMDSLVPTDAPPTWKALFRQRAYMWNFATHELFILSWRAILSPKTHWLVKAERAYNIFILLTEPLRVFLWLLMFTRPFATLVLLSFFVLMSLLSWFKTGRKDPLWVVLLFPLYSKFNSVGRFIGHFWWFPTKHEYIFKKKLHKLITGRKLLLEYFALAMILMLLWPFAGYRFYTARGKDLMEKYFYRNKTVAGLPRQQPTATYPTTTNKQVDGQISTMSSYSVIANEGDGLVHIARSAINQFLSTNLEYKISRKQFTAAEQLLVKTSVDLQNPDKIKVTPGKNYTIMKSEIELVLSSLLIK